jgi:hypothetical protein
MNYPPLPLVVTPRPKRKLLDQRDWYNAIRDGLGDQFYREMLDALVYLESNYRTPPFVKGRKDIQRYFTTGGSFRWLIYFRVQEDKIVVPAIMHPSQQPRY